jgi:hypothetical protein
MCGGARKMRRGMTRSFPWVFGYDEEGGGSIGAPSSYLFVVVHSRDV